MRKLNKINNQKVTKYQKRNSKKKKKTWLTSRDKKVEKLQRLSQKKNHMRKSLEELSLRERWLLLSNKL